MAKTEPFDRFPERYERWFEKHYYTYMSELNAVRKLLPEGKGIEIGVGTGRFAVPLKIKYGIEPSLKMAKVCKSKGVYVVRGVGEYLPLKDSSFDFSLLVTTICFLDDVEKALREANRILKKGGKIVVGFIDRNSPLGQFYQKNRDKNPFYRVATFFSAEEVIKLLSDAGFGKFRYVQTIFDFPENIKQVQPIIKGYGTGSFVVIQAEKI